jgi:outer membrane biosynthesis protein TonB
MSRLAPIGFTVLTLSLGLALAGCEGFDPTSIVDTDFFNTKKRLPGERKAVFPEGTPGVPQGVPMELVKGNQGIEQAEQTEQAQPTAQAAPAEPKADSKPKPKPKPKIVAKPQEDKPQEESRPTAVTVRPAQTQPAAQTPPAPAQSQVQWPDPPPMQQQPAAGAWPGSAQGRSGGVAWPDPPAPR